MNVHLRGGGERVVLGGEPGLREREEKKQQRDISTFHDLWGARGKTLMSTLPVAPTGKGSESGGRGVPNFQGRGRKVPFIVRGKLHRLGIPKTLFVEKREPRGTAI